MGSDDIASEVAGQECVLKDSNANASLVEVSACFLKRGSQQEDQT